MEFDIKYEKVLQEIDKIIYTDYTPRSLKNFIEGYRLDENLREKQDRQLKEGLGVKRKQYVDWSEIKHHEILLANELGISIVDAGHFKTEDIVISPLCRKLSERFGNTGFTKSEVCNDKIKYI